MKETICREDRPEVGAAMGANDAGHGHAHTHAMAGRALRIAFFCTLLILAAELAGGLIANSLALLADAGHVVTDLFALGLAWFAAVQAARPANSRKTFGYHRVGILAALVNALTLILIAAFVGWEAVQRFQHPQPVQVVPLFIAAAVGVTINLCIGAGLRAESPSLNVRAAMLHVFGDVAASAGVIAAGVIIMLTGWTLADPLISLGIAVLIAVGAWRVLRETTDILLEAAPRDMRLSELVSDMKRVKGVQDVHDLHVWCIAGGMYALSCHTLIEDLPPSGSSPIMQSLTSMLAERYRIGHTTIQFECKDRAGACCEMNSLYCCLAACGQQGGERRDDTDQASLPVRHA